MSWSILSRPPSLKLTVAVFVAAQLLGWITYAQAAEPARPAAAPPPPPNALPAVRRALREFDRFLDHHPLLEDRLRCDSELTTNRDFLARNPELDDFLRANPHVAEGLKIYPRYYLNRALIGQASAPVSFRQLAPFKRLFQAQPNLERALTENPAWVRDPAFLKKHAALYHFLVQHPALARVYLEPGVTSTPN